MSASLLMMPFFDFYHFVFPLLKELNIKVLLAVSPAYILPKTSDLDKDRLERETSPLPHNPPIASSAFCTWKEIIEMHQSGLVQIASHGTAHVNLCDPTFEIEEEICSSKILIEKNINANVSAFVYPMGRFNSKVHEIARDNYRYIFRIGSAMNISWEHPAQMVYRIPADNISDISTIFSPLSLMTYTGKHILNRLRKR